MSSTGEVWRLGRRPALDGVRGVAILLVMSSHAYLPFADAAGIAGVTLFFTLSGFLITALLLEERERAGRIDLGSFYVRRARRLLPALVASTGLVALAGLVIGPWFFQWHEGVGVLLYVANWMQMSDSLGGLAGTWSLAVEEQFYLVWPVLIIVALRRGRSWIAVVAVGGALASATARTGLWLVGASTDRVYYGSDMHADALLFGCLLAMGMQGRVIYSRSPLWAVPALLAIAAAAAVPGRPMFAVTPLVVALAAVALLWTASTSAPAWLGLRPLTWIGRRSYGLYLYHCPVSAYLTLARPELEWWWRTAWIVGIALPLTVLSWRYVEQPFLRSRVNLAADERGGDLRVADAPRCRGRRIPAVEQVQV